MVGRPAPSPSSPLLLRNLASLRDAAHRTTEPYRTAMEVVNDGESAPLLHAATRPRDAERPVRILPHRPFVVRGRMRS